MRVTLDMTGTELALLYIATGNRDAGELIHAACKSEKVFVQTQKQLAKDVPEKGSR